MAPQCFGQIFHRLLTWGARTTLAALTLGDTQVFHHLIKLLHQFGSLSHTALFHQLLNAVHQRLQLVLAYLLALVVAAIRLIRAIRRLHLIGKHLHVIIGGVAQFLHQLRDLGSRRAIAHRLGQPILGAGKAFAGISQRAIL